MNNEKIDDFSRRFSLALRVRKMRQSELSERTGIPKSAISQYLGGSFEPKQDRVFLIAQVLQVSEVWLMGYDVPMEGVNNDSTDDVLTDGERQLLDLFNQVPEENRQMVLEMIKIALKTKQ